MDKQLTARPTSSNLAAACIAKKQRLEAALVAAIDAGLAAQADALAAELERHMASREYVKLCARQARDKRRLRQIA